ncbi:hypothetical protein LTR93_010861 [Exophiala xenobiotica]|nr:hypothetical protein LTR93_010861 [Exophiala xenobiotica]
MARHRSQWRTTGAPRTRRRQVDRIFVRTSHAAPVPHAGGRLIELGALARAAWVSGPSRELTLCLAKVWKFVKFAGTPHRNFDAIHCGMHQAQNHCKIAVDHTISFRSPIAPILPRLKLTVGKQRPPQNTGGDAASPRSPTIEGVRDAPLFGAINRADREAILRSAFNLDGDPKPISDEEEEGSGVSPPPQEEEEAETTIPPSAQTEPRSNTSKRRKSNKGSTSRRRVSIDSSSASSAESVYSLSNVSFPISVQVFVGKVKQFSLQVSSQTYKHTDLIYGCRVRLLTGLASRKKTVNDPPFGGEFSIIAARMKRPYSLTIDNQSDFEMACRKWWDILHEPKRAEHEMTAQLDFIYEERAISASSPSSGKSSSSSDGESSTRSRHEDSTQGRRRKDKERRASTKSKKGKGNAAPSATQRQRQMREQRAEVQREASAQQLQLVQRSKCLRQNCKNNPRMCFEHPGGMGHLPLSTALVKLWGGTIARGEATLENPPPTILMAMMDTKNRKERTQQSPHPSLSNPPLNSPNMMPNIVYNFGAPHPGLPQHPFSTTSISGGAPPIEQRSSPPQRDGDDDNNMRACFDWLSTRFPIHKARFLEIKDTVTENGWGFSDLKTCTEDQWNAMDVPPGFVAKVKKHLKDFAHLPIVQSRGSDNASSPAGSLST